MVQPSTTQKSVLKESVNKQVAKKVTTAPKVEVLQKAGKQQQQSLLKPVAKRFKPRDYKQQFDIVYKFLTHGLDVEVE